MIYNVFREKKKRFLSAAVKIYQFCRSLRTNTFEHNNKNTNDISIWSVRWIGLPDDTKSLFPHTTRYVLFSLFISWYKHMNHLKLIWINKNAGTIDKYELSVCTSCLRIYLYCPPLNTLRFKYNALAHIFTQINYTLHNVYENRIRFETLKEMIFTINFISKCPLFLWNSSAIRTNCIIWILLLFIFIEFCIEFGKCTSFLKQQFIFIALIIDTQSFAFIGQILNDIWLPFN